MTEGRQPTEAAESASQIEIACPHCGAAYRVAANLLGRRFSCHRCNYVWRWGERDARTTDTDSPTSGSALGPLPDSGELPTAGVSGSSIIDTSWAGRRLGRYRLQTILGRGGMGVVWRAHDPTLKRDVAIKILSLPVEKEGRRSLPAQLFLQEARAAAKLNHPGAITVFEIGEDQSHQFIAMELMHQGTLKDRVDRDGPMEPRDLFALMAPPARALAMAHQRGIIHRDIKPGNLMFDDNDRLKLGDFGLSEVADDPTSLRMKGRAVGSLGWVAPETARGEPTTPASDIYAFGLVLLYALTGRQWLHADSRSKFLKLHQTPPEPDLDAIPDLSPDGAALLHRCLARDPAERFLSAEELATFLEYCAEEATSHAAVVQQVRHSRQKTIAAGVLAGLVVILLGAAFIWFDLDRRADSLGRPLQALTAPETPPHGVVEPGTAEPPPRPSRVTEPARQPRADEDRARRGPPDPTRTWPGKVDESQLRYIASKTGRVYHLPTCTGGGRDIYFSNLVNYPTPAAAEADDKRPCPFCRPDLHPQPDHGHPRD
jgi:predicted Zn finger-like uncharacterized protein